MLNSGHLSLKEARTIFARTTKKWGFEEKDIVKVDGRWKSVPAVSRRRAAANRLPKPPKELFRKMFAGKATPAEKKTIATWLAQEKRRTALSDRARYPSPSWKRGREWPTLPPLGEGRPRSGWKKAEVYKIAWGKLTPAEGYIWVSAPWLGVIKNRGEWGLYHQPSGYFIAHFKTRTLAGQAAQSIAKLVPKRVSRDISSWSSSHFDKVMKMVEKKGGRLNRS